MPINENMVQSIVQEVMAKMQIADAPTGKHGIMHKYWIVWVLRKQDW